MPQSRPRLFVIGVRDDVEIDPALLSPGPIAPFHTAALQRAFERVGKAALKQDGVVEHAAARAPQQTFADLIEENPTSVSWHTDAERDQLIAMMSPVNKAKLEAAKRAGRRMVGGVYKRTRLDENGVKVQRAEVRFDDVAGCLRTPAGGSSRQVIIVVDGKKVRTRLISARETARLMGLEDDYKLPKNYNEAYHLTGDGVAVHVVRHLAEHIFEPLLGVDQRRDAGRRMTVIPCERDAGCRAEIERFAEVLKTQAHRLGDHGLDEKDLLQCRRSCAAPSRWSAASISATMRGQARVRAARAEPPGGRRLTSPDWDRTRPGRARRLHGPPQQRPPRRHRSQGLPGRQQHHDLRAAAEADEFIVWSVCTNVGADPEANAWSGVHSRLGAEMIAAASGSMA